MTRDLRFRFSWLVLVGLGGAVLACSALRSESLDPQTLPEEVRPDYAVFAQRCSKCHSLARPLNSGIVDDDYWRLYVARMRRQPGSGISLEDSKVILRFLHYYSQEEIRKKGWHPSPPPPPEQGDSPAPAPPPAENDAAAPTRAGSDGGGAP
ncbi:MAG TPA: hypothetical protein VGI39_46525 [Polyangiaceae bacterium]|jgi:hypothetical protein